MRYNFEMSSQTPVRLEATVFGRVQGVFFRQYTLIEASRLNLAGWVANHSDGSVRVIAEGDERAVQQLLRFLHEGSPEAHVERVDTAWLAASGEFTDFRVRRL